MVERYKYKCIDAYEEPENPMEWLPCPRCGLRPLVWKFDNGRATACGCGTDCYSHWSVQAESIMSVIKRSDNIWMIIIGAPHVDPILIKRIPRQGIVGIAIQLIGLKRMGRMLEYKNKQLYNKEE